MTPASLLMISAGLLWLCAWRLPWRLFGAIPIAVSARHVHLDAATFAALFGEMTLLSRIIYVLVGVSALWQLITLFAGGEERRTSTARS